MAHNIKITSMSFYITPREEGVNMSIKNLKRGCMKTFGLLLLGGVILSSSSTVYATGLNGIGQQTTQNQQVVENQNNTNNNNVNNGSDNSNFNNDYSDEQSNASAVGSLFSNLGPKESDFAKANEILRPFVVFVNYTVALGLGVLSAVLLLITLVDMFYICVPIIRKWLDGGRSAGQQGGAMQGGMSGGMGMSGSGYGNSYGGGGMGMGMQSGGYGHGGAQPSQAQTLCGQWVSDEAVAAYMECNPQPQGGGGMGMQQQPQQTAPRKMMLTSYAKKRILFFFAFGLCLVLLFTTLFTQAGVNVGVWIIGKIVGIL